jgi:hypothetical protein
LIFREQDSIFISEYAMPDDFIEVTKFQHMVNCTNMGGSMETREKLFTNRKTAVKYNLHTKE